MLTDSCRRTKGGCRIPRHHGRHQRLDYQKRGENGVGDNERLSLALRRHARPRLYDLSPRISPDLAPRERRIEVEERMQPDGTALVPLKADEIARIVQAVAATGAEAVAVCFLHSYANDTHERAMGAAFCGPDLRDFVERRLPRVP